jgi:two-component system NtrC family sensor kinase
MSVKVLFVDDDEGNLLVSEAVCGDDFEVLSARNGAVALELMRAHEVGVIVCDQRMPEMSGIDLLEKVQAEFPDSVRLLVTAYADIGAAIDAINRGRVRRYLKKPWEPEELKAEVADALERYQTRRRLRELERRLIQTERVYALGIVAAGIGHELRNPISWITTNLQHSLAELGELSEALRANDALRASGKADEIRAALQDASMGAERVAEIVSAIQLSMVRAR